MLCSRIVQELNVRLRVKSLHWQARGMAGVMYTPRPKTLPAHRLAGAHRRGVTYS
jgi:hypothetical protein